MSTCVIGIPKGSGLGTSSILAGGCVRGISEFFGMNLTNEDVYEVTVFVEQLMSTGGGWQDQVGGLTNGIKLITSSPGINQKLNVKYIEISEDTKKDLSERFALIYTGQRRLARNLLRDVVGKYISNEKNTVFALEQIQNLAVLMRFELERGNIDKFADLLNQHWEMSKLLDGSSSNTCIEQIFIAIDDLIEGKMICGAGGGGFLQVVLKHGVTKKMLHSRLYEIFQDCGVDVWESEIVF